LKNLIFKAARHVGSNHQHLRISRLCKEQDFFVKSIVRQPSMTSWYSTND